MVLFRWNVAVPISIFVLSSIGCDGGRSDDRPAVEINVSEPLARACDIVIEETGPKVDDVTFPDRVTGSFQHRSPRLAVSFFNNGNTAFKGYQVRVYLANTGDVGDAPDVKMVSTACFDREGNALENPDVEIISKQ